MIYSALENSLISVNLLTQANSTGWSVDGVNAYHDGCNAGPLPLTAYPVQAGNVYSVSWITSAISSGYVAANAPGVNGTHQTGTGLFSQTLTPTSNGNISLYSNGICTVTNFTVTQISTAPGTTIVYSAINQKWSDFRSFYPDCGWSLYENTVTAYNGQLYLHLNGSNNTNNFYGTAYQSVIQAVFNKTPAIISTYEVLSYQSNMLLVSTQGGITTPLGQQTTLIQSDFIKQALSDGVTSVTIYSVDNVYSGNLWNDYNDDAVNGSPMRGNYIVVSLTTVDGSTILKLFSLSMKKSRTPIGNR